MSVQTKEQIRRSLQQLQPTVSNYAVTRVVNELKKIIVKSGAKDVLLYDAVKTWHEIDVTSLPDYLHEVNFDILEVAKNVLLPVKKYDMIVVPLLGFTKDGYRLGRGGGWYDRFLATQPEALKVGVGYEDTLVDFRPEPHDIAMKVIVTEKQARDFRVQ